MFVTTDDGIRLHVIAGTRDGVPLVLSNSLGTDIGLWNAQADALGTESFGVALRHAEATASRTRRQREYSLDRLGKDLLAVIDASGAERADICGISIGGMTALWVAVHAPHRVRRVILANTAARIGNDGLWAERIHGARTDGMGVLADASMVRWFTEGFRARHPDVVARLRKTFEAHECRRLRRLLRRPSRCRSPAAGGQVACPALVVTGRHDPATPPADGRWLGDQIRGAKVVELEAAHLSNVERSEEFNVAVADLPRRRLRNHGRPTATRRRHERASPGARQRACRSRDGADDAADAGIPGSHHALCVGRDLDASRPGHSIAPHSRHRHHDRDRPLGGIPRCTPPPRCARAASRRTISRRSCCSRRSIAASPSRIMR